MKTFLAIMAIIWFTPLAIMIAAGIAAGFSKTCRRLCREFLIGLPEAPAAALPAGSEIGVVTLNEREEPAVLTKIADLAA